MGANSTCIVWSGDRTEKGYGRFRRDGKWIRAHRAVWELANGPIPAGLHVLHRCDNPSCVNPAHLFLGTNRDNVADCVAKGRHAHAKLTPESAAEIRFMADSGVPLRTIARVKALDRNTVRDIARRVTWR